MKQRKIWLVSVFLLAVIGMVAARACQSKYMTAVLCVVEDASASMDAESVQLLRKT